MIKKFLSNKIWAVLASGLAVLMLVILAAGLGNTQFQPGRTLARGESTTLQMSIEKIAKEIGSIPLWKQVVFWALVFVLVIIVASLFPPEWRKKILKYFLRYSLIVLAILYLLKNIHGLLPELNLGGIGGQGSSIVGTEDTTPAIFTAPKVPPALLYLISLGIILALAGIVFLISRWWVKKQHLQHSGESLENLAKITRSSLADISSGKNWEDAIILCYARMSAVAGSQRGLHRRKDLTASEFAARLEGAGLPGEAVRRLTGLFEAARYGRGDASPQETSEAIACLKTVLAACGVNE
jgi:ABC-type multidrug transport system fused ATPase/permease subunit